MKNRIGIILLNLVALPALFAHKVLAASTRVAIMYATPEEFQRQADEANKGNIFSVLSTYWMYLLLALALIVIVVAGLIVRNRKK